MRKTSVIKLTVRSIKAFFGRYMAILLTVALGVGFFSGLKISKDAMANAADSFFDEQHFYDFRIISTLGFSEDAVVRLADEQFIALAEGSKSVDSLVQLGDNVKAYKLISIPYAVNLPSLSAGRLPQNDGECLIDRSHVSQDVLGMKIVLDNGDDSFAGKQLARSEYTVVGVVDSPLYIGLDRGSTDIGNGSLSGFIYIPDGNFVSDVYSEIYLTLEEREQAYSDEYDSLTDKYEEQVSEISEAVARERYESLLSEYGLTEETAAAAGLSAPEVYVLTRNENAGYVSFENDTSIVSGIADIFPLFFVMISMLVCMTTMTRMVDEERTLIGTLKAMGYGEGAIAAKYLIYAGSATLIGWAVGFFPGTWGLPKVFWYAYGALYDFASLPYLFSPSLALVTFAVAVAGILGSAYLSCRRELNDVPARLIRPKGTKNGKRIFLERIKPLWHRLPFLKKITIRNMFRYKKRFLMMIIGIGCCAGLVVTAFGIRDSMIHVGEKQFGTVQLYDLEVSYSKEKGDTVAEIRGTAGVQSCIGCINERVELCADGEDDIVGADMLVYDDLEDFSDYWNLFCGDAESELPKRGEALISMQAAERLSLRAGDCFDVMNNSRDTVRLKVSGIFDNYIDNYVIIGADTFSDAFGAYADDTALVVVGDSFDAGAVAEKLTAIDEVNGVQQLDVIRNRVSSALSCLNYIIWLVVCFSGTLAFVVIFNLTNINLAERSREIATVEVLGFYPRETESYVLHENLLLAFFAAVIGMPIGTLFHRIVMNMIKIDSIAFDIHVTEASYILSFFCTIIFSAVVNLFMKRQIAKIKMAESLKAVE